MHVFAVFLSRCFIAGFSPRAVQPLLFLVDGTFDRPSMQRLCDFIESSFHLLSATVPVGLVVFANVVSLYDLSGSSEFSAAYAMPCDECLTLADHIGIRACVA